MAANLDKIDFKIMQMLIRDGRMSFSTIAKEVGLSDVAIKRRVERLQKKKVLRGFTAVLDLDVLGLNHPVYVGLRTELPKTSKVVQELTKSDLVCSLYQTIGYYNVLMKILSPNLKQTRKFIEDLGKIDGVLDVNSTIALSTLKDERYSPVSSLGQTEMLEFIPEEPGEEF
ncbi:MAG TPA: Lrp/AsnC family transcriptional regulator [archaeon]|nr:Lrp/AsnC family transcriptional regulator [archaeon]